MRRPIIALLASLALVALTLTSCDSGGGNGGSGDSNEAPTAAISASGAVAVGQQLTFDGSGSSDPDGDDLTFAWEFGDGSTADGQTATHTYDAAGDFDVTLTVTDDDGAADTGNTEVSATQLGPDSLMVTYRTEAAETGDPLSSDYTLDGTPRPELSGTASGSFILAAGSGTRQLCTTEAPYFQPECATFATGGANQTLVLSVNRKQVSVSVSATPMDATVQVIDPQADSLEAEATGQLQAELPKRSGQRKLVAFKPGFARDSALVPASADASESFALEALPDCSNGLDDDGDGLVDVWMDLDGNGIPTVGDAGDPGCTGPADDNEAHVVRTLTYSGAGFNDTTFVSSDPDHWITSPPASTDFQESIQVAVGNIYFAMDVKLSSSESGEGFANRFTCGSSVNTTQVVEDDPSVDGWYRPVVLGIVPEWFQESTNCEYRTLHKAFVNNNPGDGNDDVIFGYPSRTGTTVISWVYEPDNPAVNGGSTSSPDGAAAVSEINSGTGQSPDTDSDVTVRDRGYANLSTGRQ